MQTPIKKIYIVFLLFFFTHHSFASEVFVSLKKNKVNVRYGPSLESDIKYVYKKLNLPLKQIDKKENFRRIIDFKNNSGWIHISQLKKANSLVVLEDKIIFSKNSKFSRPLFKLEKGRLVILKKCKYDWCKIKSGNYTGWLNTKNSWGKVEQFIFY